MKKYPLIKHAATTRTTFLTDFPITNTFPKPMQTGRVVFTGRCSELFSVIQTFNNIIDKYQEIMTKMPPDVCPREFPKSFSTFKEVMEQFIRTMHSYLTMLKEKDNPDTVAKNSNIVAVIDEVCIVSEKISAFLSAAKDLNANGMTYIISNIEKSFQTIFYINNCINDAIRAQGIVNQELISRGLELYRNAYKAYKVSKNLNKTPSNESSKENDINDLKAILSLVNSEGFHLLTKQIPSSINNRSTLIEFRSMMSCNCSYIGSLCELQQTFNHSMSLLILDILALIRLINSTLAEQQIPAKLDVQGLTI